MYILRRIRIAYHFAWDFKVYRCSPLPSSAPASRGTFPQGKVLAVAFSCCHSTGAIPNSAARAGICSLPYRVCACFHHGSESGGPGRGLDWCHPKGVTKNVLVTTAKTNRVGQGAGWIGATPRASLKMCLSPPQNESGGPGHFLD